MSHYLIYVNDDGIEVRPLSKDEDPSKVVSEIIKDNEDMPILVQAFYLWLDDAHYPHVEWVYIVEQENK
jgi:hypothetical protein